MSVACDSSSSCWAGTSGLRLAAPHKVQAPAGPPAHQSRTPRRALPAGTPWTLAAYAVEGKADKNCQATKTMMLHNPALLHALLEHITQAMITYVGYQIEAGAQVGGGPKANAGGAHAGGPRGRRTAFAEDACGAIHRGC